jgi:alpha-D-xyloside xylohydrolase
VVPVTKPGVTGWPVYLPKSAAWYNFWTGQRHASGQTVVASAPLATTPVFVQAGAIVPLGKRQQCTGQKTADTQEVRVYPGTDGRFDLYEDESYRYEQGQHTLIDFAWDEKRQVLTIGPRQGAYPGALAQRVFNFGMAWRGHRAERRIWHTSKTSSLHR